MKIIDSDTTAAWVSGQYTGTTRAYQRATIQKINLNSYNYNLADVDGSTRKGTGVFTSAIFGQTYQPIELPNLKSVEWERSVDQDVATATIILDNTAPLPLGLAPLDGELDQVGYYSPLRGEAGNRWGYEANGWAKVFLPDMVIRTYEGYGRDLGVAPEADSHMYPSGVWSIDGVQIGDGLITLTCRDLAGPALNDQIVTRPIVPEGQYPLQWTKQHAETKPIHSVVGSWRRPSYKTDSNIPYIDSDLTDGGAPYVNDDGSVYGHHGRDAFDSSDSTFWLSVGNRPHWSSAYEYVEGKVSGTVKAVRVHAWGGPYTVFVSVKVGGVWKGKHKIPYRHRLIDSNADIHFVAKDHIGKEDTKVIKLPKAYVYDNVQAIRVTFHHLFNSGLGHRYRYRAGIRKVEVSSDTVTTSTTTVTTGDVADYIDVIKWLCAWAGFYWPPGDQPFITHSDGDTVTIAPDTNDPIFPEGAGRVWGDLENSGVFTHENDGIPVAAMDKQPIMAVIRNILETIGYLFFIDEAGGVICRSPNVFSIGNYLWGNAVENGGNEENGEHVTDVTEIDEATVLTDLRQTTSSHNVRELVFVGNITGKFGATAPGYNENGSKWRRVGGWTDQQWADQDECQRMVDLITMWQSFQYRTYSLAVAGYPGIQIDDQVRVFERQSGDHFLHYVRAIHSRWDADTGEWTYELTTNWLGSEPFTSWPFDPTKMDEVTQDFLTNLGKI